MPDARRKSTLLARHGGLLDRARALADSQTGEQHAEAVRVLNQLAEAFAWLTGATTEAAFAAAEVLLSSADERLGRLDPPKVRRASGATRIR